MSFDLSNYLAFVSGFNGFLGSSVVNALLINGVTVVGLKLKASEEINSTHKFYRHAKFMVKAIDEDFDWILNDETLNQNLRVCFHFAGEPSGEKCQKHPEEAYHNNVILTLKILEFCRSKGINKFIYPSTGYVYGDNLDKPGKEENQRFSSNIYTATKIAAESLIESYSYYYNMDCIIARLSNVYGKNSTEETIAGKIIKSVLKQEKIIINSIKPIRDFIYINDVIDGFLILFEKEKNSTCAYFNISTGIATSIKELAETACKLVGLPSNFIISRNIEQYSDTKLVLSRDKMKAVFNWDPKFSIEEGLSEIINGKKKI